MSQKFNFQVYLQRKLNQLVKETTALSHLLQNYSQGPRNGNNLSVHSLMNVVTHIPWNTI